MIFATKQGTTFIYPGTGTGGWESALQNTLSPGDKVVFEFLPCEENQSYGTDTIYFGSVHPLQGIDLHA